MTARIGVITDASKRANQLRTLLESAGYDVVLAEQAKQVTHQQITQAAPDAWVVTVAEEDVEDDLNDLLGQLDAPVLFGETLPDEEQGADFNKWSERLLEKLQYIAIAGAVQREAGDTPGDDGADNHAAAPAENVWVLAASLGGPEALKLFCDELPADLPVALVYAQHIDTKFEGILARSISKGGFKTRVVEAGHTLRHGLVSVVPVANEVKFSPGGEVVIGRKSWAGPYSPSIDQVIADIGRLYKGKSGVIVFSGMGADGQMGTRVMHNCGGKVWVQRPDTCINSSMPDSVIATGLHSFIGDPKELAHALIKHFRR